MIGKIRLRDLECYINATEDERNRIRCSPDRGFDLSKLPTKELADEYGEFIRYQGHTRRLLGMKGMFYPFNQNCHFLKDAYPELRSIRNTDLDQMIHDYRKWLLMNGKNAKIPRKKREKEDLQDSIGISYFRQFWKYFNQESAYSKDQDIWVVEQLPFKVKQNPVNQVRSISFKHIADEGIRREVKDCVYLMLQQSEPVGTVLISITAVNRFSKYLHSAIPDIHSLTSLNREVMENYLIHLNIEEGTSSSRRNLYALKRIFETAGNITDDKKLSELILPEDISPQIRKLPQKYSQSELTRLNAAIIRLKPQLARMMILHELLGTRISDTLLLKQDCLYQSSNGRTMIRIYQNKTNSFYSKPVGDNVIKLIQKSIEYTIGHYNTRQYIFVRDSDPSQPMQYGMVTEQLRNMIYYNDLRDDHGELFRPVTHVFRVCYGSQLAEQGERDEIIAALLGHHGTGSVKFYRQISPERMQNETAQTLTKRGNAIERVLERKKHGK